MKKFLTIALTACLAIFATSCGSSNERELTADGTAFSSGELSKYLEVVDEPATLTFDEKEGGLGFTQYYTLKLKLRLKKAIPLIKDVDPADLDFTSLMSVIMVQLLDENGNAITVELDASDDTVELKKLLQSAEGTTAEITFKAETNNHEEGRGWFESAVKFKPYLTADGSVEIDEDYYNFSGDVVINNSGKAQSKR